MNYTKEWTEVLQEAVRGGQLNSRIAVSMHKAIEALDNACMAAMFEKLCNRAGTPDMAEETASRLKADPFHRLECHESLLERLSCFYAMLTVLEDNQ